MPSLASSWQREIFLLFSMLSPHSVDYLLSVQKCSNFTLGCVLILQRIKSWTIGVLYEKPLPMIVS